MTLLIIFLGAALGAIVARLWIRFVHFITYEDQYLMRISMVVAPVALIVAIAGTVVLTK